MGHCSYQFPILNNGTAAHALDDAAGGVQQVRVGDMDQKIPVISPVLGIDFQNFHRIFLYLAAGNGGTDGGGTFGDFGIGCHRQRFSQPAGPAGAEYSLGCIFCQFPHRGFRVGGALQLPRFSDLSPDHFVDPAAVGGSSIHDSQGTVAVADTVAQGAEAVGLGIIIGDGADACDAAPEIDSQPGPFRGVLGPQGQPMLPALPGDDQIHLAVAIRQGGPDIFRRADGESVDFQDPVPDLQACLPGRGAQCIVKGGYGYAMILQCQADDLTAGNQQLCGQDGLGQQAKTDNCQDQNMTESCDLTALLFVALLISPGAVTLTAEKVEKYGMP